MKPIENNSLKKKSRAISAFLKKTYQILQNSTNFDIVRWASNGVGFVVINQERFSKQILPMYFKHSNYSSFVRQLNMYNFHKIRQGQAQNYFYHEMFIKSNKNSIAEIKRKPEKKKRKMEQSDDQSADDVSICKSNKKVKENNIFMKQLILMEQKPSISDLQKKQSLQNTLQLVCSQHDPLVQQHKFINTQKNILSMQLDDDRISINEEIGERCPRFHTRELICPSNGLIPFAYPLQLSNFSLFL